MREDEEDWAGMGRDEVGWYDQDRSPRPPIQCERRGKIKPSQPIFLIAALSLRRLLSLEMSCILRARSSSIIETGLWDPAS